MIQGKSSAVALLMAMTLLGVFPLDVLLPSFPALADHFQTSPADIALSVSLFAVGISLSQLMIGPLSDSIGRKRLLLAGMAISVAGAIGCLLATDFTGFLLFRVIQAIGCGSFVLSQALVQDFFQGQERDRLRILLVTVSGVFITVSPLLGSMLQKTLDWPGSFYLFIGLAIVVFLKTWHLPEGQRAKVESHQGIFRAYRKVYTNAEFNCYWLIAAITFACHFSFIVVSPLIFMDQLHMSAYQFSLALLLYGAAYITGGMTARLLSARITANMQIIVGLGLIFLSGPVMLLLSGMHGLSTLTVLIPMIICTAGITITRPIATSKAMDVFVDNSGTSASAGNTLVFICGGVISALVNLSGADLQFTLAFTFVLLSTTGLGLNYYVSCRSERSGRRSDDGRQR
ncbi:Inner membrane transport protein YdhC [compost metagenome]